MASLESKTKKLLPVQQVNHLFMQYLVMLYLEENTHAKEKTLNCYT